MASLAQQSGWSDRGRLAQVARQVSRVTGLLGEAARRGFIDQETLGGALPALQATADRVVAVFLRGEAEVSS